jgi:2-hydroxychromene-2-carboxylate isomerase
MSIRSWLMPAISQHLLSQERLQRQRAKAERSRRASGRRHEVRYFHQVDDPYSALVAGVLPQLLARYDIALLPQVVGPPPDAAAPDRPRLVDYSRRDAARLAAHFGLGFVDPGRQPAAPAVARATALLVAAVASGHFVERAGGVSARLWEDAAADVARQLHRQLHGQVGGAPAAESLVEAAGGPPSLPGPRASAAAVAAHLAAADAERRRLGHYLGATFHYAGEWYWGLDRLHHLERRLQELGAQRRGVSGTLFAPDADLSETIVLHDPPPIDFFFSLRSPYSAIVAPRVFDLGRHTGAPVRLRYVLPMVMRGLPVPREKRTYIIRDAAREARDRGIAFGRLNDPVGRPTERGLALMPLAEREGKGPAYLLSFMRGVWAEGLDAGSDRGLRRIVERAGLDWSAARDAIRDDAWRAVAEANRREMLGLGLWGVPSFRVRDVAVWGQDRLWAIERALLAPSGADGT